MSKEIISVFVSMSKSLILPSNDPLTRIVPVLLKARHFTPPQWPYRLVSSVFVSTFQSLIVLSYDPLARIVPILLKTTE